MNGRIVNIWVIYALKDGPVFVMDIGEGVKEECSELGCVGHVCSGWMPLGALYIKGGVEEERMKCECMVIYTLKKCNCLDNYRFAGTTMHVFMSRGGLSSSKTHISLIATKNSQVHTPERQLLESSRPCLEICNQSGTCFSLQDCSMKGRRCWAIAFGKMMVCKTQ